jgi:TPR repeat protein
MKTLLLLLASVALVSATPPKSEFDLRLRKIRADGYKKQGYDFDPKKVSLEEMDERYERGEKDAAIKKEMAELREALKTARPLTDSEKFELAKENADKGILDGMITLANSYFYGIGTATDHSKAVVWSKKVVERAEGMKGSDKKILGVFPCYRILGSCYYDGTGAERDYREGVRIFQEAAEQGDDMSQMCLGMAYIRGHGVPKDNILAYKWLNLAASGGDDRPRKIRDEMGKWMPTHEVLEAQRLSREWVAKD